MCINYLPMHASMIKGKAPYTYLNHFDLSVKATNLNQCLVLMTINKFLEQID